MNYDSDILTLIYSMNENQRIDFSILINNMKNDLDKNLLKFGSNFTCDDILLRTIEITKQENIRKLKVRL